MYLIYSILYFLVLAILFLPEYRRRPATARKRWISERLGSLPLLPSSLWVHAVSVGEVNAAIPLLRALRDRFPQIPIVLSTVTDTGQQVARDKAPPGTEVVYLPFDLPFALRKGFRRVNPRILIILETELWPNLFRVAVDRGVPVVILNGRISERSARGYRKISFFMRRMLSLVTLFGMQSGLDAERIRRMGAPGEKIKVLGNFKFDMEARPTDAPWLKNLEGPVIVAGSTHGGEEEIMLRAYREARIRFPFLKMIIAPRHPERFPEVGEILRKSGIPFAKRSEIGEKGLPSMVRDSGVILLDTMGELSAVYRIATVAVIGKSFTGFGGQNPLEPAQWGKAILCGPRMENFTFIREFYEAGAAFEVEADELAMKIVSLLESPVAAAEAGGKARQLYERNSGAVHRAVEIVGGMIASP